MSDKVRVLIVDDSRTMRAVIRSRLIADKDIEVVGEAADPYEAREAIKALNPDVVTLDVEMPRMNGLEFLEKIMRLRPTPVIMISTLTQAGAGASVEALALGAFDVIGKPAAAEFKNAFFELPEKIKAASKSMIGAAATRSAPQKPIVEGYEPSGVVAIGASTGGVEALLALLAGFPANCPPTIITQHMPAMFTTSFAKRLDNNSAPSVLEAYDGAPLTNGKVYLAPGGEQHLQVVGTNNKACRLIPGDPVSGHRPSVDVLFESVAAYGAETVGVLLTGMGADGAKGLKTIRDAGGATIGQDKGTSIVYGMPRIAFEMGGVETQLPLNDIAGEIMRRSSVERRAAS